VKPSSSARRAKRPWSRIVGSSRWNASIGKNAPSVSRPGANILWKPLESLTRAVLFTFSTTALPDGDGNGTQCGEVMNGVH
jgi:hypothetical protein